MTFSFFPDDRLQDLIRSIEADRECVSAELEQAQIENDRLGEELEGLSEKLNREGHKVRGDPYFGDCPCTTSRLVR